MMVKILQILLLLSFASSSLFPQDGSTLANSDLAGYFTGKLVILRINMPADVSGVDLRPGNPRPVLERKTYKRRIHNFHTSIPAEDCAIITGILVAGNEIAVLLDGGGYGTRAEDRQNEPKEPQEQKSTPTCPKAKGLQDEIDRTRDSRRIRHLQTLLEAALKQCQETERIKHIKYVAEKQDYDNKIHQRRIKKGARFTIKNLPTTDVTPEVLMNWLATYVDFSPIVRKGFAETNKTQLAGQASSAPAPPYFGDWQNSSSEVLRLENGKMHYGYCTFTTYKELFRLDTEQILVVKSLKDLKGAGRFILIKAAGANLTLTFYRTLKDLQTGVNKTEEIWSRQ